MRVSGRDTSACVINWGGRAIISLDSVLQLHQLSLSIYSRKKENGKIEQRVLWKYFNTLKKYFAFWENIYIIVVFIFCCCEVSVNYVGLDTFNRRLAPGQSRQKDRFSMTNPHYSELGQVQGVKAGPHRPGSWQFRETDTGCYQTIMREEERY